MIDTENIQLKMLELKKQGWIHSYQSRVRVGSGHLRDERKRHISASENDGSILKTVPERAFEIFLFIKFVMVRPTLWRQFYILCQS